MLFVMNCYDFVSLFLWGGGGGEGGRGGGFCLGSIEPNAQNFYLFGWEGAFPTRPYRP